MYKILRDLLYLIFIHLNIFIIIYYNVGNKDLINEFYSYGYGITMFLILVIEAMISDNDNKIDIRTSKIANFYNNILKIVFYSNAKLFKFILSFCLSILIITNFLTHIYVFEIINMIIGAFLINVIFLYLIPIIIYTFEFHSFINRNK